jgi:TetR/AcrR family transcriptional regulator, transcriptional repressor for nem operon
MTTALGGPVPGRPREFDFDAALDAALNVFWRRGYAATSLDELTAAMGLSRSSFYGAFGSKHDVLLASVARYADRVFATFENIAVSEPDALTAVRAIVEAAANPPRGEQGCLLVNSIGELAPGDEEVSLLGRVHVNRVVRLLGTLLVRAGHSTDTGDDLAGALLSCAFGATTLRKAGLPDIAIAGLVRQAYRLLLADSRTKSRRS